MGSNISEQKHISETFRETPLFPNLRPNPNIPSG